MHIRTTYPRTPGRSPAGLGTSSYTVFSHLGFMQYGILPLLNGQLGPFQASVADRNRAFTYFIKECGTRTIGSFLGTAVLAFSTAYLHPEPLIKQLCIGAGALSVVVLPITKAMGFIDINNAAALLNTDDSLKGVTADSAQGRQAAESYQRWQRLHRYRMGLFGASWGLLLFAMMLSDKTVRRGALA